MCLYNFMVAVPHCNPHPLKHTLNMILLLVGGGAGGWGGNLTKKMNGLKNHCRCYLLCATDWATMTQRFIKTVSVSAARVSAGGRGFKCIRAPCIISCRPHIVTILLPGLQSTLSLSHHLATSGSNSHLKMKPPFVRKGGVFLNEVGRPQRLSGDQE